jgi:hypothetical protein
MGMDPNLQEKLRALEMACAVKLVAKLQELEDLLQRCLEDPPARSNWLPYRALHSLAGSTGTFGFTELGLRARKIEEKISQ